MADYDVDGLEKGPDDYVRDPFSTLHRYYVRFDTVADLDANKTYRIAQIPIGVEVQRIQVIVTDVRTAGVTATANKTFDLGLKQYDPVGVTTNNFTDDDDYFIDGGASTTGVVDSWASTQHARFRSDKPGIYLEYTNKTSLKAGESNMIQIAMDYIWRGTP